MGNYYSKEIARNIWLKDKEKLILQGLQEYNIARIELNSLAKDFFITTKTLRSYIHRLEELGFISGVRTHNAISTFKVIRPTDVFAAILSEYYHTNGGNERCRREKKKPTMQEAEAFYKGEESAVGLLPAKPTKAITKPHSQEHKQKRSEKTKSVSKVKVTSFMDKPVTEWKPTDFVKYHSQKYLNVVNHPHPVAGKYVGMAKNLISNYGHENVKLYIDTFFDMGFDNMTFNILASSSNIGHIQTYLSTGKLPFFIKTDFVPKPDEDLEISDDIIRERQAIAMSNEWIHLNPDDRFEKEMNLKNTDYTMYVNYLYYRKDKIELNVEENKILYPFSSWG